MNKKTLSLLLAVLLLICVGLSGCGDSGNSGSTPAADSSTDGNADTGDADTGDAGTVESEGAVHLTLAHADTETDSLFGECMNIFKNMVEEKSGGDIIIDIYPNGQLGTVSEYVTGIQNGTIDMAPAASTFVANFCTDVSVFDMPFLFEDHDHVWETLDGEVGDILTEQLRDNGIIALDWWGLGFRNVTTREAYMIESIDDFRGFRIRTMQSSIHQALFQSLGADAVPMDWGELYTALQQGTVDGQENPYGQTLSSSIWEVNPIIVLTEHAFTPSVFMMSPMVEDKLTADQLAVIYECADEARDVFRNLTISINEEALEELINEKDCTFVESISKSDLQAATAEVYDQFSEYSDLVDIIKSLR